MRVALKNVEGVQSVDVSLTKGEADVTLAPGNSVRYDQLLRAIEKNGFVIKGSVLVADGTVESAGNDFALHISVSNEQLKLQPEQASVAGPAPFSSKNVEVTGSVPEVGKDKSVDTIRYSSIAEK